MRQIYYEGCIRSYYIEKSSTFIVNPAMVGNEIWYINQHVVSYTWNIGCKEMSRIDLSLLSVFFDSGPYYSGLPHHYDPTQVHPTPPRRRYS